jgi:branched-chain amino acid transport system ATP-binding protein
MMVLHCFNVTNLSFLKSNRGEVAKVVDDMILEVKGVTKRFGGLTAVNNVDLTVTKGKRHVIIGPNGSGKTTFINVLTGYYRPEEGSIKLFGEEITGLQQHMITEKGLARTFQNIRLFSGMTVWENIALGMHCRTKSGFWESVFRAGREPAERKAIDEKVKEISSFLGIEKLLNQNVMSLPYGKQRVVEIGRGIATNPQILFLDEPAAGMNTNEVGELAETIKRIGDLGITVILIEHNMDFVKDIAHKVIVLDSGKKIAEGSFDEIHSNPQVIEAYLGKGGVTKC